VNTGDSANFTGLSPAVAGSVVHWAINLGLAPQALCLRLLSQAKKTSFDFEFCCKASLRSNRWAEISERLRRYSQTNTAFAEISERLRHNFKTEPGSKIQENRFN
jgi:hypothetical protein